MHVQTDYSGLNQTGAPLGGLAAKRVVATPAREGDRAQEDRRQQQNDQGAQKDSRPVFRTLLTEGTLAGLNAASSKSAKTPDSNETLSQTQFIRTEKVPQEGPSSISSEETNGLFSYLASNRKNAEAAQSKASQSAAPLPQAFVDATSRYAQQAIAAANVFAGRGETLELQA
ncbi:MAG: hypothetical protein HN793_05520 [Rhodospirillaceae bacterium]|nr:hypothetical protein [Rhodospirillaceae bacterium]MBT5239845.1 hypothetical protein [Rhodospirillaceae bacterium]MBT5567139.1 hypothetical protein [Rhodospirillaceae bacterium]MBT6089352.1 hypothetical protein [Rhodospirillaceae bacterium]MBT7450271.1 hypothetical protein [Rhodospirillaceae bacterium]